MASSAGIHEALRKFDVFFAASDVDTRVRLQKALDVIHRAIDIFGLEGVCFSFNGGKDSTVVLHLLRIVIAKRVLQDETLAIVAEKEQSSAATTVTSPRQNFVRVDVLAAAELERRVQEAIAKLPVMYFDSHDQFPEVREFIEVCIAK
jgi:FAD synthetase